MVAFQKQRCTVINRKILAWTKVYVILTDPSNLLKVVASNAR